MNWNIFVPSPWDVALMIFILWESYQTDKFARYCYRVHDLQQNTLSAIVAWAGTVTQRVSEKKSTPEKPTDFSFERNRFDA